MTKPKVFIVGHDQVITRMFVHNYFPIINKQEEADIICFIGGADIDPFLYGEKIGPKMFKNSVSPSSDARDVAAWKAKKPSQFAVGVCRGAQAINCFNGGRMYQHVTNHTASHTIHDTLLNYGEVLVTSSHHQMMIPTDKAHILGYSESISNEYWGQEGLVTKPEVEAEVLYYKDTRSLCYQGHPEWELAGLKRTEQNKDIHKKYFFDLIERLY